MPGTHPPNILVGDVKGNIPANIITYFRVWQTNIGCPPFAQPQAVFIRLYKTPPIRFSQAGGQSAHKARPPNLELALTPLVLTVR